MQVIHLASSRGLPHPDFKIWARKAWVRGYDTSQIVLTTNGCYSSTILVSKDSLIPRLSPTLFVLQATKAVRRPWNEARQMPSVSMVVHCSLAAGSLTVEVSEVVFLSQQKHNTVVSVASTGVHLCVCVCGVCVCE